MIYILKTPKKGAIKIHMGLIQEYRSCYTTTFPIINGDNHAGVTIHEMTLEIDAGAVYAQSVVAVDPCETGQSLYYKCTGSALSLFKSQWDSIKIGLLKSYKVDISKAHYYRREHFPSLKLDH